MLVKGSFEDYIYILVGLVWVGVSIYKGMQKKKSQQETQSKSKKKSVLESIMDEFLEKNEAAQSEDIIYEAPSQHANFEEKEEPEVFSYDDEYEKSNYNEVLDVYDKDEKTSSLPKKKLKVPRRKQKNTQFNLRKAVIYSEILNRRYF